MTSDYDATQNLKQITDKRLALESLIKITLSIQSQQQSLLELAAIAKPSQDFPKKLMAHVSLLSNKIGDLPVTEIIQRLDAIELVIGKSLNKLLALVKIDIDELRDNQLSVISVDDFIDAITNFKRRTQTSIALRFILRERGVAIAPFSLAVPQESISGHIESLKKKENKCIKNIRKEIVSIIKDCDGLTANEQMSEGMKEDLLKVRKAMQVNIEHLDAGGTIGKIPNVFETIVLESQQFEVIPEKTFEKDVEKEVEKESVQEAERKTETSVNKQSADPDQPAVENLLAAKKSEVKNQSFWRLFQQWLSSPWNVSWNSLKNKNKK